MTEILVFVGLVWISLSKIGGVTMTVSIIFHRSDITDSIDLTIKRGLIVCQFIKLNLLLISITANHLSIEALKFRFQTDLAYWETFRGGHFSPPCTYRHHTTIWWKYFYFQFIYKQWISIWWPPKYSCFNKPKKVTNRAKRDKGTCQKTYSEEQSHHKSFKPTCDYEHKSQKHLQ